MDTKLGDLIYYKLPGKSLEDGLILIFFYHNMLEMVSCHEGEHVVVLYVFSFAATTGGDGGGQSDKEIDEEEEHWCLGVNDPFWDEVISIDEELFDVEVDVTSTSDSEGAGASTREAKISWKGKDVAKKIDDNSFHASPHVQADIEVEPS